MLALLTIMEKRQLPITDVYKRQGYVFILDNGNNKSKIKDEYVPAEDSYTRGVI